MSASFPPSQLANARKLRPWYLLAAMILTGFIGLYGALNNLQLAKLLRGGTMPNTAQAALPPPEARDVFDSARVVGEAAGFDVMATAVNRTFALSIAQMLLCGLLFVASTAAMSGRKGSRGLALQAILALAILNIVTYQITRDVRIAYVEAAVRAGLSFGPMPHAELVTSSDFWWWFVRLQFLAVPIVPLALAAFALTRSRTKAFFEAAARASEREDDA